jgi:hypothetical protein
MFWNISLFRVWLVINNKIFIGFNCFISFHFTNPTSSNKAYVSFELLPKVNSTTISIGPTRVGAIHELSYIHPNMKNYVHVKFSFCEHLSSPHWPMSEPNFYLQVQILHECVVSSLWIEPTNVSSLMKCL